MLLLQERSLENLPSQGIRNTYKKCLICKQLQFHKNIVNIGQGLEKIYVDLSDSHKNLCTGVICKVCKRALQNEKLQQFVIFERIEQNKPLQITLKK